MTKSCVVCGKSLVGKRKDTKTCSNACRVAYKKLRDEGKLDTKRVAEVKSPQPEPKLVEPIAEPKFDKEAQMYNDIQNLRNVMNSLENQIQFNELNYLNPKIRELEVARKNSYKVEAELKICKILEEMSDVKFYNHHMKTSNSFNLSEFFGILDHGKQEIVNRLRRENRQKIIDLTKHLSDWRGYINNLSYQRDDIDAQIAPSRNALKQHKKNLERLEDYYYSKPTETKVIEVEEVANDKPTVESKPFEPIQSSGTQGKIMSGLEIAEAQFQPVISFEGELGKFIGEIDRDKFACALTGDAGAGKSEFSFQLAHLFAQQGFSVMYYTLEMGLNKSVSDRVKRHRLHLLKTFNIRDYGKLAEVHQDAQRYDCVIVDSFGKLDATADNLDNLRNTHPKTFFIFIFQKTTNGTMRGGSKIIYDCTMNIDLQLDKNTGRRQAYMVKSRYGSQGKYYQIPKF